MSTATVCYHGVYRDKFTLPLLNIHIVLGHVRSSAQASHGHIVGPLGALWSTVDLLSIELYVLYSNSDILYQRMASHTVFSYFNLLTPNDNYSGRTAPLTFKRCILYIYSTNIGTEYLKHGIYSPFFLLQNAVCFIILTYLAPGLVTFYIQDVLKFKK